MGCAPLRAGGADAVSILGAGESGQCHRPLRARVLDVEALGEVRHDNADHGCLHGRRPPCHVHGACGVCMFDRSACSRNLAVTQEAFV